MKNKKEETDLVTLTAEWTDRKFATVSSFYTGRGPDPGALGSPILEMIYRGIMKTKGPQKAANFVNFVNSLTNMAPSAFIIAFEVFWQNGCSAKTAVEQSEDDHMHPTAQTFSEATALLGAKMFPPKSKGLSLAEQSTLVKKDFIQHHKNELV